VHHVRTLRGAADGRHQLLEPLDLGVEGPVVPDLVGDAQRLEEARVHGGRADDRHVGALLEVGAALLRRLQQRQPELLGCMRDTKQSRIFSVLRRHIKVLCFSSSFWEGKRRV